MNTNTTIAYCNNNIRYVIIDGTTCSTLENCYNCLQLQLNIPNYFGFNLDALEEVFADLEWINEEKIIFILLNKEILLLNELDKKEVFLDILKSIDNQLVEVKEAQ